MGSQDVTIPADLPTPRRAVFIFRVYPEDGQFVSVCEALDLASCGDTVEEASDNLSDALALFLDTLTDLGERDLVLSERGILLASNGAPVNGVPALIRPDEFTTSRTVLIPSEV